MTLMKLHRRTRPSKVRVEDRAKWVKRLRGSNSGTHPIEGDKLALSCATKG